MMNKIWICILLIMVTLVPVYGETSDDVFVNGKTVNSIEIDNEIYIFVDDLRACGFDTIWVPTRREVWVNENLSKLNRTSQVYSRDVVLTESPTVYESDIILSINEVFVPCINIDGYIAVKYDGLGNYASIDANKIVAPYTSEDNRHIVRNNMGDAIIDQKYENYNFISLECITESVDYRFDRQEDQLIYNDKIIGFVDRSNDGFAYMLSVEAVAEIIGYKYLFREGVYTFERDHKKTIWNTNDNSYTRFTNGYRQTTVHYDTLPYKTAFVDGQYYIYDHNIDWLFRGSYYSSSTGGRITQRIQTFYDYGEYSIIGDQLLLMYNGQIGFNPLQDNGEYHHMSSEDLFIRPFYYTLPYDQFDLDIEYASGEYIGLISLRDLDSDIMTHTIKDYYPLDSESKCYLDEEVSAYKESDDGQVVISGQIENSYDNQVTLEIYKYSDLEKDFKYKGNVLVPVVDGRFYIDLYLAYGQGDYMIDSSATIKHKTYSLSGLQVDNHATVKAFKVFVRYK